MDINKQDKKKKHIWTVLFVLINIAVIAATAINEFSGKPAGAIGLRFTKRALFYLGCTGLWRVYVPASVNSIDPTAFSGCPHVALAGPAGSYAESYAGKNKLSFVVE